MLTWTLLGPTNLPGQLFVAAMGSSCDFSARVTLNYTGLALSNPPTFPGAQAKRLVPLRLTFVPTGTTTALGFGAVLGIAKATGTCTAGNFSGFSGIITSKGIPGTATGIAIVAGTASWLNGTAVGSPVHGPNWVQFLGLVPQMSSGAVPAGSALAGGSCLYDLQSEEGIMPGETMVITPNVAISAVASIAWVEVPLNSGA
jgi:hypothetical protein